MTHHKPKETCHLGMGNWSEFENELMRRKSDEHSYIHEHLATIELLMNLQQPDLILEIGTGLGDSTLAFADGCAFNGRGHIITIDIEDCGVAKDKIQDAYLYEYVTFIKSDSIKLDLVGGIDILFIDGLHEHTQVRKELALYSPDVKAGGMIIFHDSYNPAHPGVDKAIQEFATGHWDEWDMIEYFNCNGLTILRKKELQD